MQIKNKTCSIQTVIKIAAWAFAVILLTAGTCSITARASENAEDAPWAEIEFLIDHSLQAEDPAQQDEMTVDMFPEDEVLHAPLYEASQAAENEKAIYEYLTGNMKLKTASAVGILANLYCESGFDPEASGDQGTSYGICQWHESRWEELKNYCEENGYNWETLEGQLRFMEAELTGKFPNTLTLIKGVANTGDGAYNAAWYWCTYYERPANVERIAGYRGKLAREKYWPVYGTDSEEDKDAVPAADRQNIYIGDSRIYQMHCVVGGTEVWSALPGKGIDWLISEGVPAVENQIVRSTNVVISIGLNDIWKNDINDLSDRYAEYLNYCASRWTNNGASVWFCTIAPCDDAKSARVKNDMIRAFNTAMKDKLDKTVRIIDLYEPLMGNISTSDGVHYDSKTYYKVYNIIRSYLEQPQIEIDAVPLVRFSDVPQGTYYYDAVNWAADCGVAYGTTATLFSPFGACTRAQAVTFLWRMAGAPLVSGSVGMRFKDVRQNAYYSSAVLWAAQKGIASGTGDGYFSPDAPCTRGQIVSFIWRYWGSPESSIINFFADVRTDKYYSKPVLWAVENHIAAGTSSNMFAPDDLCTRAQIVTFLYRLSHPLE